VARLSGAASRDGTARFRDRSVGAGRAVREHFRQAPGDLSVTSLGLGTYIGRPDGPTDLAVEHAVQAALSSGRINVIDTAINYRYQRAERSVGRALALAAASGIGRDEVFVATKAGYLAPDGESPLSPEEWIERELIQRGTLDPSEIVGGSHAMSPGYLADQIERSRTNLGLETLDLLYLHNAADAQLPVIGPEEFRRRLVAAFGLLENSRRDGRIVSYGLATWDALRVPAGDPGYLGLEDVVAVAREVGGDSHGFRFVQMPLSWAMPEAASRRNQRVAGDRLSAVEAAARLGLGVFTSVPLVQGQLARRGPTRDGLTAAQTAIQFARSWPGVLAPLVGQKTVEHLSENLALAGRPPWDAATASSLLS
jgi:aryl-alcohol dehydrogenase-like predicted oxidoreductase